MLRINTKKISNIQETKNISDILKLIHHDSWLLLDLDNTVMEASVELGSDQWFVKLIEHACRIIPNTQEAAELVVDIYTSVQHHINTKVVEQNIVDMIKALQDIGIPVIGITARDHSLINTTFRQLHENNINFGRNRNEHEYQIQLGNHQNKIVYHSGIIFCSGNDKGKCLNEFLSICDQYPSHIVMVDDKGKHLSHVQDLVENLEIRFDGLRYGFLDEKTKTVDMAAAHIQLAHIKEHLPRAIQSHIDKLQITPENLQLNQAKYAKLFAKPNDHRKLETITESREEELEIKTAIDHEINSSLQRPGSALSLFAPKPRKAEPMVIPANKDKHGLAQ